MKCLIEFRHGLGDAIQLTSLIRQLKAVHPDWSIDVAALQGKHSAFFGLCDNVYVLDHWKRPEGVYDRVENLGWWECDRSFKEWPSTKVEKCLLEVWSLEPNVELSSYKINISPAMRRLAARFLRGIAGPPLPNGRYRTVCVHYQGNTEMENKNLDHQTARNICEYAMAAGYVPIILDWDHRSPLPDGGRILCPDASHWLWRSRGTGDAEAIAALIEASTVFIGIDSGPQKVAGATATPALGVWTRHHPIHYFSPADNFTHLIPEDHQLYVRRNREDALGFFEDHYRFRVYRDLNAEIKNWLSEVLKSSLQESLVFHRGFAARAQHLHQDDVIIGDVYARDAYAIEHLPLPTEIVVDVGAHIGAFAARWRNRNPWARIVCVEACPENIDALRANVGAYAEILQAACTYDEFPVALANSVWDGCASTGGSRVVPRHELFDYPVELRGNKEFWHDDRPLEKVTLEGIMERFELPRIDILKLDCEGSEHSILGNCGEETLAKIGVIIGEYHGLERFKKLVEKRLSGWTCQFGLPDPLHDDNGSFWLFNNRWSR